MTAGRTVLWWGCHDPEYSRNRNLRQALAEMGWQVLDFQPTLRPLADLEARLRRLPVPDLVWVPCFRQRDVAAARRWSRSRGVPLVFDPLISAYDKQVFERRKFPPQSLRARRLLAREAQLLASADLVLADTGAHAQFFHEYFGISAERLAVVYVGADEDLFYPATQPEEGEAVEVLFCGSFIALQGPQVIARAASLYQGPPVTWRFIGNGPLLQECRELVGERDDVRFDDWVPYARLGDEIRRAQIVLGVFGTGSKAGRVIPNKVFQALACGKPVITRHAPAAYPAEADTIGGIDWVEAGDAEGLCRAVATLAADRHRRFVAGGKARTLYDSCFASDRWHAQLRSALCRLGRCDTKG